MRKPILELNLLKCIVVTFTIVQSVGVALSMSPELVTHGVAVRDYGNSHKVQSQSRSIILPLVVFDSNGKSILELDDSEIGLFINGERVSFTRMSRDEPINYYLVIDNSPSIEKLRKKNIDLGLAIAAQMRSQDKMAVFSLSGKLKKHTDLTDQSDKIAKEIKKIREENGSSIYNGLSTLLRRELPKTAGRKVLILISDGIDTTSRTPPAEAVLHDAERSDATIFILDNNQYDPNIKPPRRSMVYLPGVGRVEMTSGPFTTKEEFTLSQAFLNEISTLSGGAKFRFDGTESGKTSALSEMVSRISNQHLLKFTLPTEPSGKRLPLQLTISRPGLSITARPTVVIE